MGVILDTSILIAAERRGYSGNGILRQFQRNHGLIDVGISTISVVELTHGIYRAKTDTARIKRRLFANKPSVPCLFIR